MRRKVRVRPPTKRVWRPTRSSHRRRWKRTPLPQYGAGKKMSDSQKVLGMMKMLDILNVF